MSTKSFVIYARIGFRTGAPLSNEEWEKQYRKSYGKAPTGTELQLFKKNLLKPMFWKGDDEDSEPTNDEP